MTTAAKAKAAAGRAFRSWTAPIGSSVEVTKDGGEVLKTTTRSMPWMLCGAPVILVDGISGGYLLTRVRVIS